MISEETNLTEVFLNKFCNIKEKAIFMDYQIFKYFANESNYDTITLFVIDCLKSILKNILPYVVKFFYDFLLETHTHRNLFKYLFFH
jgi:hypothetical protein